MGQSIDGYIAKTDHGLDWLEKIDRSADDFSDYGYKNFMSSIDTLIMGRNTYNVVSSVETWPHPGKRVIVLSTTLTSVCAQAELFAGDITDLVKKLQAKGAKHIYVDGGVTASQFMNAGLVDYITLSIIPVILGAGIPLFNSISLELCCRLIATHVYPSGLVQLRYATIKNT